MFHSLCFLFIMDACQFTLDYCFGVYFLNQERVEALMTSWIEIGVLKYWPIAIKRVKFTFSKVFLTEFTHNLYLGLKWTKFSYPFFSFHSLSLSSLLIASFSNILFSQSHDHKNQLFDFRDLANFWKLSPFFLPGCLKLHANHSSQNFPRSQSMQQAPSWPAGGPTQPISTQTPHSITDFTECQMFS